MNASLLRARRGRALRTGFTLIEILVVIVVIAILATLVAPNVFKHVGEAKVSTAKAQMEELTSALQSYRLDMGVYPTTDQGLAALAQLPTIDPPANWRGPYLSKPTVPLDPWGRAYIYVYPGQMNPMGPTSFDLISYGLDGQPGDGGDPKSENADIYGWQ